MSKPMARKLIVRQGPVLWTAIAMFVFAGPALAQQEPVPQVENIPAPGVQLAEAAPVAAASAASMATPAAATPAASRATSSSAKRAALPVTQPDAILPAKTPIELQLETHLSTRFNVYGDGFAARVARPVYYQGQEVVPTGSIIEGHVIQVHDGRPVDSNSELLLKPDQLTMPNGRNYTISAHVIATDPHSAASVNREGVMKEPRGLMSSDIHHGEIGAGTGLVGGAVLAGTEGALIGTGLGIGVAAGIWLIHKRHLSLNPGSMLTVKLDRPLALYPQPGR